MPVSSQNGKVPVAAEVIPRNMATRLVAEFTR